MKRPEITTSVIIPTHNRQESIIRLLDKLGHQSYPLQQMEVIVIANSCSDNTVSRLREYNAPYQFRFAETQSNGPALPRNTGASMATGSFLIFIDDDIEPSDGFVEAHVKASMNINDPVVIGYLPYVMPERTDYYRLSLRAWWEQKYSDMERPGHRFKYDDLLSGNFSISSDLFNKVSGFMTGFTCRDDYELGMRLIAVGANFVFSREAWGYHHDTVTDLDRSLKRKVEEGKVDVQLSKLHPEILTSHQQSTKNCSNSFLKSKLGVLLFTSPKMADIYAAYLRLLMSILEYLNLHAKWKYLSRKLHTYWYYRGLLQQSGSEKELISYLSRKTSDQKNISVSEINLEDGIDAAERFMDIGRPESIILRYGSHLLTVIHENPGYERLRGRHLKEMLANEYSWKLMKTAALARVTADNRNKSCAYDEGVADTTLSDMSIKSLVNRY